MKVIGSSLTGSKDGDKLKFQMRRAQKDSKIYGLVLSSLVGKELISFEVVINTEFPDKI